MRSLITPLLLAASGALAIGQVPVTSTHPVPSTTQREAYIAVMKKRIAINERSRDPFGLLQELGPEDSLLPPRTPQPSLQELMGRLPISAVDPSSRTFLIGPREFQAGQVFPLIQDGKRVRIRVLQVKENAIHFQNPDSGERAIRSIQLDPRQNIDWQDIPAPKGIEPTDLPGGLPVYLPS